MSERAGYRWVVTTEPTVEPITLAEAKTHLRVDHNDEDDYIESLIIAARQWAENETHRRFINTTLRLSIDCFPEVIRLPGGKTQSITSIVYIDTAGVSQTLSTSYYTTDTDSEPARIVQAYGYAWPAIRYDPNAVKVTYVAGYGAAATAVPDGIKAAISLVVGNLYENREATISGTIIAEVPMAAKALLDPFRLVEFI